MIKIENSSNIEAVDYEESTKIFTVEFKGGMQYEYLDVPVEAYEMIDTVAGQEHMSVGKYINEAIKGVYKFRQVLTKKALEKELKKCVKAIDKISDDSESPSWHIGISKGTNAVVGTLVEKFGLEV